MLSVALKVKNFHRPLNCLSNLKVKESVEQSYSYYAGDDGSKDKQVFPSVKTFTILGLLLWLFIFFLTLLWFLHYYSVIICEYY